MHHGDLRAFTGKPGLLFVRRAGASVVICNAPGRGKGLYVYRVIPSKRKERLRAQERKLQQPLMPFCLHQHRLATSPSGFLFLRLSPSWWRRAQAWCALPQRFHPALLLCTRVQATDTPSISRKQVFICRRPCLEWQPLRPRRRFRDPAAGRRPAYPRILTGRRWSS